MKKLLSYMKKTFSCNGYIKTEDDNNDNTDNNSELVLSLTGDQRENVKKLLLEKKIIEADKIKIHGF
jgi:translation initiation factor 1 (eIF-1/SUI1)